MAKTKTTQIQILERVRGERDRGVYSFSDDLRVSAQWYYACLDKKRDPLSLQALSELAMDHVGDWIGETAVECIRLIDARFIPCPCQTTLWDNGPCPKHGVSPELVEVKLSEVAA